jgi:hypothetical protein
LPNDLIWLGLDFLITKLYLNSFLAMLNARNHIRKRGEVTSHTIATSSDAPSTPRGKISISVPQESKLRVRGELLLLPSTSTLAN